MRGSVCLYVGMSVCQSVCLSVRFEYLYCKLLSAHWLHLHAFRVTNEKEKENKIKKNILGYCDTQIRSQNADFNLFIQQRKSFYQH